MTEQQPVEIVTQAVAERKRHGLAWAHTSLAQGAVRVLGVQVGNTSVDLAQEGGQLVVDLLAECDLWYSCVRETQAARVLTYCRSMIPGGQLLTGDASKVQATLVGVPQISSARICEDQIVVCLEAEVEIEIVNTIRLWVKPCLDSQSVPLAQVSLAPPPSPSPSPSRAPRRAGSRRRTALSRFAPP